MQYQRVRLQGKCAVIAAVLVMISGVAGWAVGRAGAPAVRQDGFYAMNLKDCGANETAWVVVQDRRAQVICAPVEWGK
jgi:hypothetical protein